MSNRTLNNMPKDKCPVCDMETGTGQYALEYRKMFFHFCTEQCRETFLAHPGLYSGNRVREYGEIIKNRTLYLAKSLDVDTQQAASEYLQGLMGIKDIQAVGRKFTLRYDLLQLTLAQVEKALSQVNVQLDNGWWQRLRRNWVRNIEANELENLAINPSACCNRPPPGR